MRRPESNAYLSRGFQEAAGFHAGLSQLVENLFCNQDVWGSSPQFSTKADLDVPDIYVGEMRRKGGSLQGNGE